MPFPLGIAMFSIEEIKSGKLKPDPQRNEDIYRLDRLKEKFNQWIEDDEQFPLDYVTEYNELIYKLWRNYDEYK